MDDVASGQDGKKAHPSQRPTSHCSSFSKQLFSPKGGAVVVGCFFTHLKKQVHTQIYIYQKAKVKKGEGQKRGGSERRKRRGWRKASSWR